MVLRVFSAAIAAYTVVSCSSPITQQHSRALPAATETGTAHGLPLEFSDDAGTYSADIEPPQPAEPGVLE